MMMQAMMWTRSAGSLVAWALIAFASIQLATCTIPTSYQDTLNVTIYPPWAVFTLNVTEPILLADFLSSENISCRSYFLSANVSGQSLQLLLDLRYDAITVLFNDYCSSEGLVGPCFNPLLSSTFTDYSNGKNQNAGDNSICSDIHVTFGSDYMQLPELPTLLSYFFWVQTNGYNGLPQTWRGGGGRVGLARPDAYVPLSVIGSLLNSHGQPQNEWVVLDLNGFSSQPSTLQLGGSLNNQQPIWTELNYLAGCTPNNLLGYYLAVYHLGACGVDMLSTNSQLPIPTSNLWTVIDLAEPCLVVPTAVFDALIAWLPITCDTVSTGITIRCSLYNSTFNSTTYNSSIPLPPITFQLSEGGPVLSIPLQNLVLNDGRICLRSFEDVIATAYTVSGQDATIVGLNDLFFYNPASIVFGTRVLESFQIVLDWSTNRTGFVQKGNASLMSNSHCAQSYSNTCVGVQIYNAPLNTCLAQDCTQYLFQVYDPATAACVPAVTFQATILTVVCLLTFIEMFQMVRYRSLLARLFWHPEAVA